MTEDDPDPGAESAGEAEAKPGAGTDIWARETAPQSPFTTRQVGVGVVVLAIGLAVSFGLPLFLG